MVLSHLNNFPWRLNEFSEIGRLTKFQGKRRLCRMIGRHQGMNFGRYLLALVFFGEILALGEK